jgi:hypothetical protein
MPPVDRHKLGNRGWGEQQLPDGALILTSPAGHRYKRSSPNDGIGDNTLGW